MTKGRLEAFSDGVIAIIITIMVLEMKVPHGDSFATLRPLIPVFFSYVLSFLYIGIYWNNHHHMLHTVKHVSGAILWANLHLLFWLSLLPFVTGWLGENHFSFLPTVLYGCVLFMSGVAYLLLAQAIIYAHGPESLLAQAIGKDHKGVGSIMLYAIAIPIAFVNHWIALGIYVFVALMWLVPDKRVEQVLSK